MEVAGLQSRWISGLFLVTVVAKLPSSGALWHTAARHEQSPVQPVFTFSQRLLHLAEHTQIGCCGSFQSAKLNTLIHFTDAYVDAGPQCCVRRKRTRRLGREGGMI